MTYRIIVSKGSFDSIEKAAYGETTIVWDDDSSAQCVACTECFSAVDAKGELERLKGIKVDLCDVNDFNDGADVLVFLGDTAVSFAAEKYALPYKKVEKAQGYRVYMTEKEGKRIVLLHGDGRCGSIYAMDEYMEYHGIRFISPGEDGAHYRKELDRNDEVFFEKESAPSFRAREAYSEFMKETSTELLMWLFHNKYNFLFLMKIENGAFFHKLGIGTTAGGHTIWYKYLDINHEYPYKHKLFGGEGKPEDPYEVSPLYKGDVNGDGVLTYGEAHPEWFCEVDGERTLRRNYEMFEKGYATGDFICTSNQDAMDEFSKLIVQSLIDGEYRDVKKFKLYGLDNGTWCQCKKCTEAGGEKSYKMLVIAYNLDKAIKKANAEGRLKRKIEIAIPAYHETLPPPDKPLPEDFDYSSISVEFYVIERCYLHNIDDQKCIETNKVLYDRLMGWKNCTYKGDLLIGEYYNVSTFAALPFVFKERIKNDVPFYYSSGARLFVYLHMLARVWGMQSLNNFLLKELLWDINCDADKKAEEYFIARYGEDAPKMKEVYRAVEKAGENCKYYKHYQWAKDDNTTRALSRCLIEGDQHFFPLKHAKLDYRVDDYQAGPSLLETRDSYEEIFADFKAYIKDKNTAPLTEDYEQLEYAVNIFNYIYYKAYSIVKEADKDTVEKVKFYATELTKITRPLRGYDFGHRYENGLTSTGVHEL